MNPLPETFLDICSWLARAHVSIIDLDIDIREHWLQDKIVKFSNFIEVSAWPMRLRNYAFGGVVDCNLDLVLSCSIISLTSLRQYLQALPRSQLLAFLTLATPEP